MYKHTYMCVCLGVVGGGGGVANQTKQIFAVVYGNVFNEYF